MTDGFAISGRGMQAPSLGDAAYVSLKDRLTRGAYRPGDKLTVRSVAEALGVSSTPARDAVNRLAAEGALVYAGPKTVILPILSASDLREITLIRIAIEGLAAELAVPHCRDEDLEKLGKIQNLINSALDRKDYGEALWHNKEFHFLVYRMSGLPHLVTLIENQWLRVGPSFYDLYPEFAEDRRGVRNHEMAMEALADRDAGGLKAAFESDIREGYRRLRHALVARMGHQGKS